MPIWKITDDGPVQVTETKLKQENLLEEHLEDWIIANHELLGERLLIIGRQVMIPDIRDRIDVLALDAQGNAVVIELKRGPLKDPVDMQALRYASYVAKWGYQDFENQARSHLGKVGDPNFNFNEMFEQFCSDTGVDDVPDLNGDQRIIIVGSEVRAKLGSVALWLYEHNIDVKVIEIEVYREGKTLFLQPQTIIPLPVSRFSDTGGPKTGDGTRPWIEDGKNWHLDKRCSPKTREMMLRLDDLIRDNFDVDGPRWNQKSYAAYRVGNNIWLWIDTRPTMLRLHCQIQAGVYQQQDLAHRLGIQEFDSEDSLSEKLDLPSSVSIRRRSETKERITVRLKKDFDLENEALLNLLQELYQAFSK